MPSLPSSTLLSRRSWIAAATATALGGCSAAGALNALVPRSGYRLEDALAYGAHPRQRLDVYVPDASRTPGALVVFFYGGSWSSGDRGDYRFVGEALASAGHVAVVADYRLNPEVRWRAILQDCAAATRWAFDNAQRLGVPDGRVYLMGHSAGGYNAAMLALDSRWLAAEDLAPRQLGGWIGLAGPYDFLPPTDRRTQEVFDWPRTPSNSQPMVHVSGNAPRALLLASQTDHVVDTARNTVALANRLRSAGASVRFQVLDRVNHVTLVAALAAPLRHLAPVRSEILEFVGQDRR